MKRYINYSIIYAVLALVGGVFYREFTKMNGYTAWTSLSVVHTHYFILGMMFFLILGLVSFNVNFKSNFYREFTKMNGYTAWTSLSVVHTHYFILGMMFFLILGLVSFNVNFKSNRAVLFYNVGLNLTAIMLVVRGIVQVLDLNVVSAVISGIAGIGHMILGVSLILILLDIKKSV